MTKEEYALKLEEITKKKQKNEIKYLLELNGEFDFIKEIPEIEQLLKEINMRDKDFCLLDEIVLGYCMAKKEGCQTIDEIFDWLEKWEIIYDMEYPDMYLNYEGKWRVRL